MSFFIAVPTTYGPGCDVPVSDPHWMVGSVLFFAMIFVPLLILEHIDRRP